MPHFGSSVTPAYLRPNTLPEQEECPQTEHSEISVHVIGRLNRY